MLTFCLETKVNLYDNNDHPISWVNSLTEDATVRGDENFPAGKGTFEFRLVYARKARYCKQIQNHDTLRMTMVQISRMNIHS